LRADAARVVENVAASIADGAQVDWVQADAQVGGRELRLVRHLRVIDSVAGVYRTLPSLVEDEDAPSPHPDFPEGPRWGRLILLDRIGRGSSADVFRAWDAELQREVALKLLQDEGPSSKANALLLQEARRLARIRHPHVVHVYGAERHEEQIGLWMEFVRGRSLDDIVREEGAIDAAETAHIGIDLCSALSAVHGAGLLHRDVKAQNVIREDSGRLVLMDFGTGEEMTDRTPRLAGTPIYLAPEVLARRPASVQSDIYAIGVLLFYALTGAFPVVGESLDALAAAHKEGRYRTVRELQPRVPAGIARVVDRALAPDPRRRYASASAMEAALHQALDTLPGRRPALANQWWIVLTMVAAIVGLVAAVVIPRHAAAKVPVGEPTSIAVLPLKFISGEAQAPYLADGLTDQLITTLGQVRSLKVTAATSVGTLRNTDKPLAVIAQQLGVGSLVEGTVSVQPGAGSNPADVRVNVRLIRAGSEVELWSSSFERPLGDLLTLESDIARAVARQVRAMLTPDERTRLTQSHSTVPAADEAYLEGRALLGDYGVDRATKALDAFRTATRLDPQHAEAHAGAARAYIALGFDGVLTQPAARASALAEASRALALNDSLAEAHVALADLKFYYDWDWSGADQEYRTAIDFNPSLVYARTQYGRYLAAAGRVQESVASATHAIELDPLSADAAQTLGLVQYYARNYEGANTALTQALVQHPSHARTHFVLGRVYEAEGRYAEALTQTERAMALAGTAGAGYQAQIIRLRALLGETEASRAAFRTLQERLAQQGQGLDPEWAAYVHAALGDSDQALRDIERSIAERDPSILWVRVDPRFDVLRENPTFTALTSRLERP